MGKDEKNTESFKYNWAARRQDLADEADFLSRRLEYDTKRLQAVNELIRIVESKVKTDGKK